MSSHIRPLCGQIQWSLFSLHLSRQFLTNPSCLKQSPHMASLILHLLLSLSLAAPLESLLLSPPLPNFQIWSSLYSALLSAPTSLLYLPFSLRDLIYLAVNTTYVLLTPTFMFFVQNPPSSLFTQMLPEHLIPNLATALPLTKSLPPRQSSLS